MNITAQQIAAIAPEAAPYARRYVSYINGYADTFGISTPLRMCHYLAQILHESDCLHHTVEQGPRSYFDKYDQGRLTTMLGNTQPGDGFRYRGRGLIQITGRANYQAYQSSRFCRGDIMASPELLEKPLGAVKSSMWWWMAHDLNSLAAKDNIERITRIINGGTNGVT